jgi:hypothetical protein
MNCDIVAVDSNHPFAGFNGSGVNAIGRIIAKQMSVGMEIGHVVYGDNRQILFVPLQDRP